MSISRLFSISLISFFLFISGCSVIKASPAPDSGFLPHAELLKPLPERSPFNAVWYSDKEAFYKLKETFTKIYVAPVNTTFLESKIRRSNIPKYTINIRIEEAREIARYAQNRLMENIKKFPGTHLTVVDEPGEKTLAIEMALVELTPTNTPFKIVGTTVGFFIPGTGLLTALARGGVAMETIVRNGENNEILIETKDRETDKTTPFSVRDFQQYGHARRTIDEWARIFAELAATPYEHTVKGLDPVSINPL